LARFGLSEPEPYLIDGALDAFFAHEEECWYAHPDSLAVLRELAGRGLRLGMFSNATCDRLIQRVVDRLGFRPFLAPTLTSAGVGIRKPDPAAFEPILDAWGLRPESVVMVGDSLAADILGAQRAGMRSVWIAARDDARQEGSRPWDGPLAEIRPDRMISSLGELLVCLAQM
jgi:HAD superfamily hydrolase (TIGR01662 family)